MSEVYLGLISGTSVDGVDAALAEFDASDLRLLAARTFAYPPRLRERIEALIQSSSAPLSELGAVDVACGRFFADCALALTREANYRPSDVAAIGHHGQTVFHQPDGLEPFTMQIGDPASVAAITRIPTVADLRAIDVALGGQGAPMVPAFHAWRFASDDESRIIANIGGIANLTVLSPGDPVQGFDTGPGNTLMDLWTQRHRGQRYDERGDWAASGRCNRALLRSMLREDYFAKPAPKSTGRELFNMSWLDAHLANAREKLSPEDVQATLAELTAVTLCAAVTALKQSAAALIVCGGGAHNAFLLDRLRSLHRSTVTTTGEYGVDPDWVEALAFAWLARARLKHEPGNVPTVTGALRPAVLGGLYSPENR